ncbi:MAG: arylsulfatase, partial [Planctomycetota bacterium]
FSLLPVLLGKSDRVSQRESVFILGNGKDSAIAVRHGKWTLIIRYGADEEKGHELYDIEQDPGELVELSNQHSEVAARLFKSFQTAEGRGRTRP